MFVRALRITSRYSSRSCASFASGTTVSRPRPGASSSSGSHVRAAPLPLSRRRLQRHPSPASRRPVRRASAASRIAPMWLKSRSPPCSTRCVYRRLNCLADFGALWRNDDVPAGLKEEAAREIFERLELVGERLLAVHPRTEHAWLFGMAATKSEDLVLVGARGLEPPTSSSRTTRATYCATPRPKGAHRSRASGDGPPRRLRTEMSRRNRGDR